MIKIESIHIEELRGIRNLTLTLKGGNFVISGPNGSGKSGVVDAIQFALTGEISRLKGAGTGDLKLGDHGPHVEKRDYPDAAFARLDVYIPHLKKKASITRKIKQPRKPLIVPSDADVKAAFAELAEHSEVTLSRREIIKFILTEATQRSRDVQTLLKLDDIDQTRATLKTTQNKLEATYSAAKSHAVTLKESLKRHLDVAELTSEVLLAAVNQRRKVLGLPELVELKRDTSVSEGLVEDGITQAAGISKESALRDVEALSAFMMAGFESTTRSEVEAIVIAIERIEQDTNLLPLIRRAAFLETGMELIDEPQCPLCDTTWDVDALRAHVREKIERSKEAKRVETALLINARAISAAVTKLCSIVEAVTKLGEVDDALQAALSKWLGELNVFAENLNSVEGILAMKQRFQIGWAASPANLKESMSALESRVKARPSKDAAGSARDFLVVAQERLGNWQSARRDQEKKRESSVRGKSAYKTYCEVAEATLTGLYNEVEGDFSKYYQLLNHDDEGEFVAKFEPSDGKLGLLVDFHKKGMFPPGAYHSEGHQDGMGVCLYLALMKRVLGDRFSFAVLDDVVMSVDSQHRKQFCKLLKTQFPNTQFVITTHDQVWTRQMRTEGLVSAKSAIAFHTWTVDTGPVLDEITEVWEQIDGDLAKNEVPTAAARLRRHLEYVAADLADELAASVAFRGDNSYDMGMLLSSVIGKQGELLKEAVKVAKSWGDDEQTAKAEEMLNTRAAILAEKSGEEWIVNKAVHYNEWADLSKEDFRPVVDTFKRLLGQFRCDKCDSWLSVTPRFRPTDLRCSCGRMRLNLKRK
ncbi:MAG: AAA family ATPase [Phycisphaerales bacterium]|nr:AAA family ATPase [Phycisphaerales bacterium]